MKQIKAHKLTKNNNLRFKDLLKLERKKELTFFMEVRNTKAKVTMLSQLYLLMFKII